MRKKLSTLLILYALLTVGAVIMVYPFLVMVSNALKANVFVIEYPPKLIPENPSLENFVKAWNSNNFKTYFINSAITAVAATLGTVMVASMAAYAFARFKFRFKEALFWVMLVVLMIPDLIAIIPKYTLATSLHLRNNLWGLILFYIAGGVSGNTFLLRGFFETMPHELEEAMTIDGASPLDIFFKLALPLAAPAVATVAIFSFLGNWDEYTWALTIIDKPALRTLPIAIFSFQGQHGTQWGLVFAAMMIALIPIFIVFFSLQKYFVRGIGDGAIKG
ncbi:MAG: carbohydrate ABC transporter permease [Anaerolineaceae bacterium]|nr:carbohydrate ABC transporter permease [Anaerolineaceae bacterium]